MYKAMIFIVLAFCLFAHGQYNEKTTVFKTTDFRADSTKYTEMFSLADYENPFITVKVNDTTSAGYASDSVNFWIGLQYGRITKNYLGQKDTLWVNPINVIDTVRFAAANFRLPTSSIVGDTLEALAICTTYVSGFATLTRALTPYRYPLARFQYRGVTGNKKTAFLRLETELTQCKYTRVNIGQENQPNE